MIPRPENQIDVDELSYEENSYSQWQSSHLTKSSFIQIVSTEKTFLHMFRNEILE